MKNREKVPKNLRLVHRTIRRHFSGKKCLMSYERTLLNPEPEAQPSTTNLWKNNEKINVFILVGAHWSWPTFPPVLASHTSQVCVMLNIPGVSHDQRWLGTHYKSSWYTISGHLSANSSNWKFLKASGPHAQKESLFQYWYLYN